MPIRLSLCPVACLAAALSCLLAAGARAGFGEPELSVLRDGVPDYVSEFAAEITDLRLDLRELESKESRTAERKTEKLKEEAEAKKKAYISLIEDELEPLKNKLERVTKRFDRAGERVEHADEREMAEAVASLEKVRLEKDSLEAQKRAVEAYKSYSLAPEKASIPEGLIGDAAPDFSLSPPGGDPRTLETLSKKPLRVLVFFHPQNRASVSALENLIRSERRLGDDVVIVGIAVATDEKAFEDARLSGLKGRVLLDPKAEAAQKYKVSYVPQYVAIDATRTVRGVYIGTTTKAGAGLSRTIGVMAKPAEAEGQ